MSGCFSYNWMIFEIKVPSSSETIHMTIGQYSKFMTRCPGVNIHFSWMIFYLCKNPSSPEFLSHRTDVLLRQKLPVYLLCATDTRNEDTNYMYQFRGADSCPGHFRWQHKCNYSLDDGCF